MRTIFYGVMIFLAGSGIFMLYAIYDELSLIRRALERLADRPTNV
jgi:hypothetical protein